MYTKNSVLRQLTLIISLRRCRGCSRVWLGTSSFGFSKYVSRKQWQKRNYVYTWACCNLKSFCVLGKLLQDLLVNIYMYIRRYYCAAKLRMRPDGIREFLNQNVLLQGIFCWLLRKAILGEWQVDQPSSPEKYNKPRINYGLHLAVIKIFQFYRTNSNHSY